MDANSPLAAMIGGLTLKAFRVSVEREVHNELPADPASGSHKGQPVPTGMFKADSAVVFAVSPAEAWALFCDGRHIHLGPKAPGVKIEAVAGAVPAAA